MGAPEAKQKVPVALLVVVGITISGLHIVYMLSTSTSNLPGTFTVDFIPYGVALAVHAEGIPEQPLHLHPRLDIGFPSLICDAKQLLRLHDHAHTELFWETTLHQPGPWFCLCFALAFVVLVSKCSNSQPKQILLGTSENKPGHQSTSKRIMIDLRPRG